MTPFELALQVVAGVEPGPTLAPLQQDLPKPDLEPGWLDKRVVFQDRIWINRELRVIPLAEMTPLHRSHVIRFLRDLESDWQLVAATWLCHQTALGLHSAAATREQARALGLLTPGWTTRTPPVRRLLDLIAGQLTP